MLCRHFSKLEVRKISGVGICWPPQELLKSLPQKHNLEEGGGEVSRGLGKPQGPGSEGVGLLWGGASACGNQWAE